jgi:hypothetical protein
LAGQRCNLKNQELYNLSYWIRDFLKCFAKILSNSKTRLNGILIRVFHTEEDTFFMVHQELVKLHSLVLSLVT